MNPDVLSELESHGMLFVGQDVDGQRMEIMELQGITVTTSDINFTIPSLVSY